MRATFRFIGSWSAAALAGSLLAAGFAGSVQAADTSQTAATVRVSVVGIDRAGAHVRVFATAYSSLYPPLQLSSRPHSIPAGQYWIGAAVTTPGAGSGEASQTLVVRHVMISHSGTVSFDARPGKLVKLALSVPGAVSAGEAVQACIPGQLSAGWGESGSPGTVYVVPLSDRRMAFDYTSTWQAGTIGYYLADQVRGGIPRRPDYRQAASGLARQTLVLHSGTITGSYQNTQLQREFRGGCGISALPLPLASTPSESTAYLTAGTWQLELFANNSFWGGTRTVRAGHSSTDSFGAAVFGPGVDYPTLDFGQLAYFPLDPFGDPQQSVGGECCDRSSISLIRHGRTLKHQTMTEYKAEREFVYRLHAAGWYTMQVSATRLVPGQRLPAGLLSTSETTTWRFHVPSDYATVDSATMPVTATRYLPQGLNLENQARLGPATRIVVRVLQAVEPGWRSRRFPLRTVRMQASFDGGKVWRAIRLVRHGAYWVALVPAARPGYVALRSTVTDTRGDSTVQTIDRAYQIG